jgi:hypothetical protein
MLTPEPIISADSHVAETEEVFADIDPKYRDVRPRAVYDERAGAMLAIPNIDLKVPMGLLCTGGRPPQDFRKPVRWEIYPAGHDPGRGCGSGRGRLVGEISTRASAWCSATIRTAATSRPASRPTTAGSRSSARRTPSA